MVAGSRFNSSKARMGSIPYAVVGTFKNERQGGWREGKGGGGEGRKGGISGKGVFNKKKKHPGMAIF